LILDTNALSAFIAGEPSVGAILRRAARAVIPVIVLGEFRYGIVGSRYRRTYEAWLESHLRHFEVLGIAAETTLPYADLRTALKRMGRPIPANDAWIAALAIQHKLSLLSRDTHFDAIAGVQRVGW
jgi:predicted nucleic acid-binding protein